MFICIIADFKALIQCLTSRLHRSRVHSVVCVSYVCVRKVLVFIRLLVGHCHKCLSLHTDEICLRGTLDNLKQLQINEIINVLHLMNESCHTSENCFQINTKSSRKIH